MHCCNQTSLNYNDRFSRLDSEREHCIGSTMNWFEIVLTSSILDFRGIPPQEHLDSAEFQLGGSKAFGSHSKLSPNRLFSLLAPGIATRTSKLK